MYIVSFTKLFSLVVEWNLVCDRLALLSTVQETGSAAATCITLIFNSKSIFSSSEKVFLSFLGAQDSIPPAYVARRAGTTTLLLLGS
jgi:hypothetical protein